MKKFKLAYSIDPQHGTLHKARRKRTVKRLKKAVHNGPKTRVIEVDEKPEYEFQVYFHQRNPARLFLGPRRGRANHLNALVPFIKETLMGGFKLYMKTPMYKGYDKRSITSVKLKEESDVFTLMMCHREMVRKIFQYKQKEAA